ncbi:hypothetical protein GCM10010168_60830 [Actinoplanes ianthinogenes]|uniref:Uncharacterized protein n=1 Tax=Actinoplanes ianthinogenes TaxID=122358 RepID=A0ABN6CP82_9ACTN|nr:hypothetical protein [Actinoplanes ianthinogenes]BCJ46444.1 hypothetical protein Aiant_71010 [Actinoplanes ianthinogenes]GGR34295.1 hypothetical protein GCM10010168_60830 [Actinoplanes ianthinogenes]
MHPTTRTAATRAVVTLVIANLALSLLFAVLTLAGHDAVLAYQRQHHPGTDPAALERTLWSRPVTVFLVALLYLRIVRQLRAGTAAALRRVRIVAVLGLGGLGWLLVSAEYPAWLRVVEIVQVLLLAALAVTTNRRTVRSAFDAVALVDTRPRNRAAAWTLVFLAPVVAELCLGLAPLRVAWVFLFFVPLYGAGALLIRETVRRFGGGYPSLLLLGVTYGLVEEGLVLQGMTSPHLYGAADWAPRLAGLNTAYAELNLIYHPVFSVTIPIILVELLFPAHGRQPYLRRGGLITTAVVAVLGALLLRVTIPPSEDPGYTLAPVAAAVIVTVALLVTAAAIIVRTKHLRPANPPRVLPSPAVTGLAAGAAAFGFLALVFPFAGADQPFFTRGAWSLLPMAVAALLVLGAGVTLRRRHAHPSWNPRHLLAVAIGATVGHTLFGLVANAASWPDRAFLAALAALTVLLGHRTAHRLRNAATQPGPPSNRPESSSVPPASYPARAA